MQARQISSTGKLLIGLLMFGMFLLLSILIWSFGGKIAFADGFVAVCGIFATVLATLRYREQWIFNFCADLALLGIWAYAGNLCMFASRPIRLVGDIYGYANWRNLLTERSCCEKNNSRNKH